MKAFIFCLFSLCLLGTACDPAEDGGQPNVLFIVADDLGYHDLGVNGSSYYETPNLDRLAGEGVQFTRAYTTSRVCSPARASLMNGQFTARHGITDWIGAKSGTGWRDRGYGNELLPPAYRRALDTAQTTLPEAFRANGYQTFFAGKWHLGGEGSAPTDHGFDVNIGGNDKGSPAGGYFDPYDNPDLPNRRPGEQLSQRLARETAEWISRKGGKKPFFAMLSFYAVHAPLQTSPAQLKRFRAKAAEAGPAETGFEMERRLPVRVVQDNPVYAGLMNDMDTAVGLVLDRLKADGLLNNTIIVFTSDHGGVASGDAYATSNLPLRGGKGYQWEGGLRVPLFMHYPPVFEAGRKSEVPITGADIYPTLMALAGQPMPADRQVMDGIDLTAVIRKDSVSRRALFWHYPHYGNQGGDPASIMIKGTLKLIHYWETDTDELYDLRNDPGEKRNLAPANVELTFDYRNVLLAYLDGAGARLPTPDPEFDEKLAAGVATFRRDTLLPLLEERRRALLRGN